MLHYFSITSAIAVVLATALIVSGYGWHKRQSLVVQTKAHNTELAQVLANAVWTRHSVFIKSAGHLDGDRLRTHPDNFVIDREVREILSRISVLKVKIYHPNALTIYSTDFKQMGDSKRDNAAFTEALASKRPRHVTSFRETFGAHFGVVKDVHVAETYVPIIGANGDVIALFELYNDVTSAVSEINRNMWWVALLAAAVFGTLYGALFLLVKRADAILTLQRGALVAVNRQLEDARARSEDLNAKLEEKVAELEYSNGELREFAQVASHDLQEPLRKIEAFASRLTARYGKTLPADGQMFIERMCDASGRMRRLINDLLDYSRAGQSTVKGRVDLEAVASGVLSDLQVRIEETGASVKVSELPTIEAEAVRMRQLLQNLIGNALKFRKPDVPPAVEVQASLKRSRPGLDAADQLVLRISDNGIGFDPAYKDQIFKIFQRLHGRAEYDGTGIGLATCRKIVERHGGTIEADGKPGLGATFTIVLPIRPLISPLSDEAGAPRASAQPELAVA